MNRSLVPTKPLVYGALGLLALVCILPFWIMLMNATRTNAEILSGVSFLPGTAIAANLDTLLNGQLDAVTQVRHEALNIPRGFLNSLLIALTSTALGGYFGALTAYGFAVYQFRFRKFLWGIVLAVMMIPPTVGLIGFYKLIATLNMIDSYWPLILPAAASPFAVFFLRNYYLSALPRSLIEAARIDGAGELRTFHVIGLPLALPGVATISILGFLGSWNAYLGPLIVLTSKDLFTLPLWIQQLNTSLYARDFGAMYMGIALSVIPILIMFAFFSRFLIQGMTSGSLKE